MYTGRFYSSAIVFYQWRLPEFRIAGWVLLKIRTFQISWCHVNWTPKTGRGNLDARQLEARQLDACDN
jgi:hypothetical protein